MTTVKNCPGTPPAEAETKPDQEASNSRVQDRLRRIAMTREKIFRESFTTEVLSPNEMTPERIREISDFFRFMFNNAWGEYVVCTQCDPVREAGMKTSAMSVFGTDDEYVPLDQMDSLTTFPDCPCCSKPMELFHDPEATFKKMQEKLQADGYASLLKKKGEDRVSGFTFGYGSTIEGVFNGEWRNRYNYLKNPPPEHERDLQKLIEQLNIAVPGGQFSADTPVFGWNCIATAPWVRSVGSLHGIMTSFFDSLPREHMEQYVIGEALSGSTAHKLFLRAGAIEIKDYLEGDGIIVIQNLGTSSAKLMGR